MDVTKNEKNWYPEKVLQYFRTYIHCNKSRVKNENLSFPEKPGIPPQFRTACYFCPGALLKRWDKKYHFPVRLHLGRFTSTKSIYKIPNKCLIIWKITHDFPSMSFPIISCNPRQLFRICTSSDSKSIDLVNNWLEQKSFILETVSISRFSICEYHDVFSAIISCEWDIF